MEKTVKIQTGRSLSKALEKIIRESTRAALYQNGIEERQAQHQRMAALSEDDDTAEEDLETPDVSSKTVDDEKEKLKKGEITPDDIIEKLNAIRSGKSFKDEEISSKLNEYIESLSKPEKVALLAFLKGISQVVTGEIEPEAATDPSDAPADVEMKKPGGAKTIKPVVVKAPQKEKTKKSPSSEDTSGPVPITPKKK